MMDASLVRVLIIDHHTSTVDTLARSLHRVGRFEVVVALSVEEALDVLRAGRPDVVLLDLALSIGDGHGLLRRLRQRPEPHGIPVLMVTAHQGGPEIRAAARAGAAGFIPQPLNAAEICYKIEQAVRPGDPRAAEVGGPPAATPPSQAFHP